jgi:hypothetical protein
VASRRLGVTGELKGGTGRAPSNESGGGSHPNSGTSVGRWGGAVRWHSPVVELVRWSPTTRPKSCTMRREREESEVGIKRAEGARSSDLLSG